MILGKYNQAKTVYFDLFQVDGVDFEPAATFAAGDVVIMKDEGVEANTTNLPTDEGTGYSLVLTATEMSAARIKIYIVDQTATKVWLDTSIHLETYGNASAEHAFDLDTASTPQTADHTANISSILTDTGTTLDTKLNDIQGATFSSATDSLEAIRDRGDAAWVTGGGGSTDIRTGTAQAGAAGTITLDASASAVDDFYNGTYVHVDGGTGAGQVRIITDYVGSTKVATIGPVNWITNPDATSTFRVVPEYNSVIDATNPIEANIIEVSGAAEDLPTATALATIDANVDAILIDTGTTLQAELDAIQAAVITNAAGADIAADIIAVKAETATIVADTNEIQGDLANGGRLDLIFDELTTQGDTNESKIDILDTNVDTLVAGVITGAAVTGTLSTTQATSDLTGYTDDQLIGRVITFTSGACDGESSAITDYASASGLLTFDALTLAPGNTDTFKIT